MRIAVSGTQCIGKSTFVKDFIANWNMYKTPDKSYTSLKTDNRELKLNEGGNEESQRAVLNFLCDQVVATSKHENIIFDRSVLDNLIYTMWLNGNGKVSDEFVKETIQVVKNTLVFYDVIFFCPITKHTNINLEESGHRSIDPVYRTEIDNIFKAVMFRYLNGDKIFFPIDHELGCPGIVEIYGNREERVMLAKMYVNENGKSFNEEQSLISNNDEDINKDAASLQRMLLPNFSNIR